MYMAFYLLESADGFAGKNVTAIILQETQQHQILAV